MKGEQLIITNYNVNVNNVCVCVCLSVCLSICVGVSLQSLVMLHESV